MNLHPSTQALIDSLWPDLNIPPNCDEHHYDKGFKDAVESMCLTLQSDGVPTMMIHRAIRTVADAHANNC